MKNFVLTIDSTAHGIRDTIQITNKQGTQAMVFDLGEFDHLYDYLQDPDAVFEVAKYISDSYTTLSKTSVWFDMAGEGYSYRCLSGLDKVVKCLINNFGFAANNLYYRSGVIDIPENYDMYLQICSKFDWIPLNLVCTNTFEHGTAISENALIATTQNLVPNVKNKIFTSLNRSARDHRLYIIGEILRRGLDSKSYFSAHIDNVSIPNLATNQLSFLQKNLPQVWKTTAEAIRTNVAKFPIRLNLGENHTSEQYMNVTDSDINYYTSSYFHLITETKFFHDQIEIDIPLHIHEVSMDCYFFTEKTYKAIVGRVPFILVGFTGALAALRDRGYKTFHPFINESYDLIENDEDRLDAIMEEVIRLSKFSDQEWLAWQANVIPIIEHNFNLIRSRQGTESQI